MTAARMAAAEPATGAEDAAAHFLQELAKARTTIQEATKTLERLNKDLGASMERYNLCGSAQKRLAMVERIAENPKAKEAALKEMRKWYQKAKKLELAKNLKGVFYPVLNLMATECLLHACKDGAEFDLAEFSDWRQKLEERSHENMDFFSEVGVIEWDIYAAVAKRNLSISLHQLLSSLEILHQRVKDPIQWESVHEQLDFVLPDYIESFETIAADEAVAARQLHETVAAYGTASWGAK